MQGHDETRKQRRGKGRMDLVPLEFFASTVPDPWRSVGTFFGRVRGRASPADEDIHAALQACWTYALGVCWDVNGGIMLIELSRLYEFGAEKYEAGGWRQGVLVTELLQAGSRHFFRLMGGERMDPETNLHHIIHIVWQLLTALWMIEHMPEYDDRFACDE